MVIVEAANQDICDRGISFLWDSAVAFSLLKMLKM